MHRSFALASSTLAAAALFAAAPAAQAATVLNVSASGLCGPSGCFSDSKRTLERTWSASQFQGPVTISALQLDKNLLGSMQNYAVRVSFQDASGATVGNWGAYTLAVLGGEVVTLGGEAVNWDTARGDLTLKLELLIPDRGGAGGGFGLGGGGGGGSFAGGPGGGFGSIGGPGAAPAILPPPLLPITANLPAALVAVPEPGSWALMLTGFMGAGAMLRRGRQAPLKV